MVAVATLALPTLLPLVLGLLPTDNPHRGMVPHQAGPAVNSHCIRDGTNSLCWREDAGRVVSPAAVVALVTGLDSRPSTPKDGSYVLAGAPYHNQTPVPNGAVATAGMRAHVNAYRTLGASLAANDHGDAAPGGSAGFVLKGGGVQAPFTEADHRGLNFQAVVFDGPFSATGNVKALADGSITGQFDGLYDFSQLGLAGWYGGVGFTFTYKDGDFQVTWNDPAGVTTGVDITENFVGPASRLGATATLTPQDLAKWGKGLLGALEATARKLTEPPPTQLNNPAGPGTTGGQNGGYVLVGAKTGNASRAGSSAASVVVGTAVDKPGVPATAGGTSNPPSNPGTGSTTPPASGAGNGPTVPSAPATGSTTPPAGGNGGSSVATLADSGGSGQSDANALDNAADMTADDPADSASADPDTDATGDQADETGPDASNAAADSNDTSSATSGDSDTSADSSSKSSGDNDTGASSDGSGDSGAGSSGDGGSDGGGSGGDGGSGGGGD